MKTFLDRHIGVSSDQLTGYLSVLGLRSIEQCDAIIPASIRRDSELSIRRKSEVEVIEHMKAIASKNISVNSLIGMSYYPAHLPAVIGRNILENPAWYTAYTPYQAEISQGRLEFLHHFQTMICELTQMAIANASLLDDATAVVESMLVAYRKRHNKDANRFYVVGHCFPQLIKVLKTRSEPLGIELEFGSVKPLGSAYFGALIQYPDGLGEVGDLNHIKRLKSESNPTVVVHADLLSLALLKAPGSFDADIVCGSTQRFGLPMGFGGPHAGFIAAKAEFLREMPGRIIGASKDRLGKLAYRMALQTREQHIRREKATSNICTAQALLAILSTAYAMYHGADGLKDIATQIHEKTAHLHHTLTQMGFKQINSVFFDTLCIEDTAETIRLIRDAAKHRGFILRQIDPTHLGISIGEATPSLLELMDAFASINGSNIPSLDQKTILSDVFLRQEPALQSPVFSRYQSETELLRYIKSLESKDLSLCHAMIPLGSCTMKLNPTTTLLPLSWSKFADIHPFVDAPYATGYLAMIHALERQLCEVTGFDAVNFQSNSGAQGELSGLLMIRAYHKANGSDRHVIVIPDSAHGTNPASAALAGFDIKLLKSKEDGTCDLNELSELLDGIQGHLAGFMVTYPSTFGVFDPNIKEISQLIHQHGGLVYMDGANMNALVGLAKVSEFADCCHINLHKTFAIPHGGGGPGMGPICVNQKLIPFLPTHITDENPTPLSIGAIASSAYSSASILIIPYVFINLLGAEGLRNSSRMAILNANYLKQKLSPYYPILCTDSSGYVAHEFIIDWRELRKETGIEVEDIAKRLMDYGFHAPTMSWPVPHTLMIEPTESESLGELDRFCEAMIAIRSEVEKVRSGDYDKLDNPLKNAPHPIDEFIQSEWTHAYSREDAAAIPASEKRIWPSVSRINNALGDRELICSCQLIDSRYA